MSNHPHDIDLFLIKKISKGESKALDDLFQKYYPPLCKFTFSIHPQKTISEEAVADVFIHLWQNRKKLKIQNVKPYLYKIARNNLLSAIKSNKEVNQWIDLSPELPLSEAMEERDEKKYEMAQQILNKMPSQCRVIFQMHKIHRFKHAEIAEILSISIKTVENHMSKALKIIHQFLMDESNNHSINIKKIKS